MPAETARSLLFDAFARAEVRIMPADVGPVRRAFRRAFAALDAGDTRPAILLVYRWP